MGVCPAKPPSPHHETAAGLVRSLMKIFFELLKTNLSVFLFYFECIIYMCLEDNPTFFSNLSLYVLYVQKGSKIGDLKMFRCFLLIRRTSSKQFFNLPCVTDLPLIFQ
jgi:hypothetical protein